MFIQRGKVLAKADPGEVDNFIAGGILLAICTEDIHHRKVIGFKLFRRVRIKLIGQPVSWREQGGNT